MIDLPYGLRQHPGYIGIFTDQTVPGAIPAGSRVTKVRSEPGDSTPNGDLGKVLGSMVEPEIARNIVYFVEWDRLPGFATATMDFKVEMVGGGGICTTTPEG